VVAHGLQLTRIGFGKRFLTFQAYMAKRQHAPAPVGIMATRLRNVSARQEKYLAIIRR
jgi:hypothetical protein